MRYVTGLVLVCLLCVSLALAQTPNASLAGTVNDVSGAVVPGAAVVVTGIDTGVVNRTVTNATGNYVFPSLQAGNYRVTAEMAGFQKMTYDPVNLSISANVRLNFMLPVAGGSTTVDVTAAAESPLLTASSVVGNVITGQQILDLPLVDRNATNLALSQAGIAGGIGEGAIIGGGTQQSLVTTLNGVNVSNTRLTRAGGLNSFQMSQSVDMVEEVKVVTSPADVELGRALGQVQMIVRSGTNKLTGSLVDGLRNTALNANTFFNNKDGLPRPDLKRNQYAARIGGPIRKNKDFFFFLYDGNRQRTSASSNQTVLTAAARAGNFRFFPGLVNGNANSAVPTVDLAGNPVRPAAATDVLQTVSIFGKDPNRMAADPTGFIQKFVAGTPLPNNYTIGDGLNTAGYLWQTPAYGNKDQFTFKVDHYFTENHHINVVVTKELNNYTSTAPVYPDTSALGLKKAEGITDVISWFSSIGLTSTIRPTVLNEFRIGFQHPDLNQAGGTRAYPSIYPTINGQAWTPSGLNFTSPIPGNIDAELINPVYTTADSITWTKGKHAFKWGVQIDALVSNSFNINNGFVPSVTFGAGNVGVTGISSITGIGSNQTAAQNLLTTLAGTITSISEGFATADGKNPKWLIYQNRRVWHQRGISGFFKDDFKVAENFTLNYGIRWDMVGAPWDSWGRTPAPSNGIQGIFGISGTGYDALWTPGLAKGSLTQIQTIGPNSQHPEKQIYANNYKNFSPAIGFSWSIPYFGKDKTVFRVGYGWTRPPAQSMLGVDGSIPTLGTTVTTNPTTLAYLNSVTLPLVPSNPDPLAMVPLTDRTQSIRFYEPDFQQPLVMNWNASLERQLTSSMSMSIRYVGNRSKHLTNGMAVNAVNIFENGILDAFKITQAGGNAPLFDTLLNGLNLSGGVVNGTTWTGSQALRNFSTTRAYFAANAPGSLAAWINTTNAVTGVNGGLLSRVGLPQNFVVVNPQYGSSGTVASGANSWYDSLVVELQKRYTNGWTFQTNYVFAKALQTPNGDSGGTSYRNPRNWAADKQIQSSNKRYAWKGSGTYSMPFGPGKQFLNSKKGASGVLGHVFGGWQVGAIITLQAGSPLQFTGTSNVFSNSGTATPTVLGSMPANLGKVTRVGNGVVYFPDLVQINDPSIASMTSLQSVQGGATMKALTYNGNVLLQNATAGVIGSAPIRTAWEGPRLFNLDMNLVKRFRFRERYDVEFRVDGVSITNTPKFADPTTSINSTDFGRIVAPASNGSNQFTMPPNFQGNRVFVGNLRISF